MKTTMNEYQIFVTKLFAACEIGEDNVVLVDTNRVSEMRGGLRRGCKMEAF